MGLFDAFKRHPLQQSPTAVLDALIKAVAARDDRAVGRLINEHRDTIRREFPQWKRVPEPIAADEAALARYVNALITLASSFAAQGDDSLTAMLRAPEGGNPMESWDRTIGDARASLEAGRTAQAIQMLTALLAELDETRGTAKAHYRAIVLGSLGIAHHRAGDTHAAIRVTREALNVCLEAGDQEGIDAYTKNLATLEAPTTFTLPPRGNADPYRIVVQDETGRTLTSDELGAVRGKVQWEVRGREFPRTAEAETLHQQGRNAGEAGDYDRAILLFTHASELSPSWPYPIYDRAFSHLLNGDNHAALADFQRTLELAPDGFFTASQSAEMLAREAAGEFPDGLFRTFAVHAASLTPEMCRSAAEQAVAKWPGFVPAWELLLELAEDSAARLDIIERALAAGPSDESRAHWQINKALALNAVGDSDAASKLLQTIGSDPRSSGVSRPCRATCTVMLPRSS
jgi:tetratricopeptide (TPR) repeat protein